MPTLERAAPAAARPSVRPAPAAGSLRAIVAGGGLFALAAAALVSGGGVVARATALYADALPPHPYFVPEHALLLYIVLPLVVLAAVAVALAPGLFLVLALGRPRTVGELVLKAFAVAWAMHVAGFAAVRLALQHVPSRGAFLAAFVGAGALGWAVWALRGVLRRRTAGASVGDDVLAAAGEPALAAPADRALVAWLIAIPILTVVALLPVLLWQDMNPDGLEALTLGRSLAEHFIPRLPTGEATGLGLGMISIGYPIQWLITAFGPVDAAARLPLALYLPVLAAGIVALAELGAPRRLAGAEQGAIVLAVALFAVVLGYNDTYHVYSADIASPANIDIAAVALMLATVWALYAGQRGWLVAFSVLTYLTRPTALMLLVLLGLAVALADRSRRREKLVSVAIALGACLVLMVGFERAFAALAHVHFAENTEHISARLRFLRFDDVRRLLYVLVPAGILPALGLLAWKRQDSMARVLTLVTAAYFAFFYVLAFYVLHHFAPAMVLPVVVWWRMVLRSRPRPLAVGATAALAGIALVLSLPRSLVVDRSVRDVARATVYRIGDHNGDYAAWRAAFEGKDAIDTLFAPYWKEPDPARERMGSPWVQVHYARALAAGAPLPASVNYLVQPAGDAAPAGFTRLPNLPGEAPGAAAYVRDLQRWRSDRYRPFDVHFRSPLYDIPRETELSVWGVPAHAYQVDLRRVLERFVPARFLPPEKYFPVKGGAGGA